ncbi:MAG TPA: HNH endonuclease, partial [Acidimicrobiales bacterium]|nr:HNH endonuclease [Acidimicrobiales bacterium]
AVEARIETWRRTGQLTEDDRSWQELVAAAVLDLIADGSVSSRRGQARPLLIVTAKLNDLFDRAGVPAEQRAAWSARIVGGGPIGQAALRELIEQANLQLVVTDDDGETLFIGRAKRLATAAMLVALIARSGGTCEFPGCHARHHRAHAHHVVWWEHGGCTDIDNLALLCPHHHRLVHRGLDPHPRTRRPRLPKARRHHHRTAPVPASRLSTPPGPAARPDPWGGSAGAHQAGGGGGRSGERTTTAGRAHTHDHARPARAWSPCPWVRWAAGVPAPQRPSVGSAGCCGRRRGSDVPVVLAHQGGWDEALMVLAVICLFVGLLWIANARAGAQSHGDDAST